MKWVAFTASTAAAFYLIAFNEMPWWGVTFLLLAVLVSEAAP